MKHKILDLASEVRRATLPEGLPGFLFPIFEAVSNSLHAIEERWDADLEKRGLVSINFDTHRRQALVSDNGTGFDNRNLAAFLTPLTGNKYERGGKGFGRFIAFKIFNKVLSLIHI